MVVLKTNGFKEKSIKILKEYSFRILLIGLSGISFFGRGKVLKEKNSLGNSNEVPRLEQINVEEERKLEYVIEENDIQNVSINNNIPIEIQPLVDDYLNKIMTINPNADYQKYYEIINGVNFYNINLSEKYDTSFYIALFDSEENSIYYDPSFDYNNSLCHELTHVLADSKKSDKGQFVGENFEGLFIDEGINSIIMKELYNFDEYDLNQRYIKMISILIGKEKLIDIYLHGNIEELKMELVKYSDADSVTNLIANYDKLHMFAYYNNDVSDNLLFLIQNEMMKMYFNKCSLNKQIDPVDTINYKDMLLYGIKFNNKKLYDKDIENCFDKDLEVFLEQYYDKYEVNRFYQIYNNLETQKLVNCDDNYIINKKYLNNLER